jgi:hypothetical protein
MIQHLYVQKVSAFQESSCNIPVLLTGLKTAAGVESVMFAFVKFLGT